MSFLNNLPWRFAAKKFDPRKKVPPEALAKILEAIRLAPSSLGLQPYHIFVISDQKLKEQIEPIARNQKQITTCAHLLVFCERSDMYARIEGYLQATQISNNLATDKIDKRRLNLRTSADKKSPEHKTIWAAKQTYIALGFALAACAELKIDSCPMGGFDSENLDKLLKLPEYMQSQVLLPIDYRAQEPEFKKIRFSESDIFTWL